MNGIPCILAVHEGLFTGKDIHINGDHVYTTAIKYDPTRNTITLRHTFSHEIVLTKEEIMTARSTIVTNKLRNQMLWIEPTNTTITPSKISNFSKESIGVTLHHAFNDRMSNFGLTALTKFEKMLRSTSKQGWLTLFQNPKHFVNACYYVNYWITHNTDGAAFRYMYSTYLDFLFSELNDERLKQSCDLFNQSARLWIELSNYALSLKPLQPLNKNLEELTICFDSLHAYKNKISKIQLEKTKVIETIDLDAEKVKHHFTQMSRIVRNIKEIEDEALAYLQEYHQQIK
ncbi:hypothetical protein Q75_03540 [Bacillus coahuilensis p1.1.43]|uniref:Uncharacterized protein n=1 Tax=Bacillus coahuilensis p1.1.43 TaxID=1150625 RepID=A0A147KAM6_9BACI|nr:DUF4872 domain-containing protein [Bacillus coahuilensis]KUP07847.1 hypothetical protein Q75_03540 [Bacillus coahuilensis p1.1.43]